MKLSLRIAQIALLVPPVLAVGYFLAAWIGSSLAANAEWTQPDAGVELFVETNGFHTAIMMPIRGSGIDWSDLVAPDHIPDPDLAGTHITVGWGHAGVYRNTPRWRDLRLRDALSAVAGSDDVLLHVYHDEHPYPTRHRRALVVSEEEYRTIAGEIRAHFRLDGEGRSIPSPGYGETDLFYEATGHYDLFNTCNSWTGHILRDAGVRMGRWTPFAGSVMRWVPKPSGQ